MIYGSIIILCAIIAYQQLRIYWLWRYILSVEIRLKITEELLDIEQLIIRKSNAPSR